MFFLSSCTPFHHATLPSFGDAKRKYTSIDIERLAADLTDDMDVQLLIADAFYDIESEFKANLSVLFYHNRFVTTSYRSSSGEIFILFSNREPMLLVEGKQRLVYWPDQYLAFRINYVKGYMRLNQSSRTHNDLGKEVNKSSIRAKGFSSAIRPPNPGQGWIKTVEGSDGPYRLRSTRS
jgi:hypothetical protein